MEKVELLRTGAATALTVAIISTACAVAVNFAPEGVIAFVNSWTHGLDLATLRSGAPLTLGGFVQGPVNVSLTGFVVGALFAWCLNLTAARPRAG
jgi:hypothetical protein